jgi:hemerythrin-like metal-binding protein
MFAWSNRLDTGIKIIDDQHRELVGMLARLFEAMQSGAGNTVVEQIIKGLEAYARDHFAVEEQLMVAHGYPDLEGHLAAHKIFQSKVAALKQQDEHSSQGVISIQVVLFLRNWLTEHIGSIDQALGAYLLEKDVG